MTNTTMTTVNEVTAMVESRAGLTATSTVVKKSIGKREQFMVSIVHVDDLIAVGNEYIFDEQNFNTVMSQSTKVLVSENRLFRMFSKTTEMKHTLRRGEDGRAIREEGELLYDAQEVRSAKEFMVVNLNNAKEQAHAIKTILAKGFIVRKADGTEERQQRVVRSASQVRVHKAIFTSLDVQEVREAISYGSNFGEEVIIAQMEARFGQATSSTLSIDNEFYDFDVMPDYAIERTHDIKVWNDELKKLQVIKNDTRDYEPLDGQGTMLPSAAVRTAHRLALVSRKEREYLLNELTRYNEDVRIAWTEGNKTFMTLWSKIPSAFQVRLAFCKGLLVVFPHNLPEYRQDCNGNTTRSTGKPMPFWNDKGDVDANGAHHYDFDREIMFTDSMWKANFNPKYLMNAKSDVPNSRRVKLEIVLWQKNRQNPNVFMGYQYWQSLQGINVQSYADTKIKELKDTIFTDWKEAMLFLGQYDTGRDVNEYEEKMDGAAGKIQKVVMLLNENPELIQERWVQEVLRDTREKYVKDMAGGRIPVTGANPYIITAPECQFGLASELADGEYYYDGEKKEYTLFRSPLIHKSETVVINTTNVSAYTGLFQGVLVMNPYDDTLPRMGGADTDGDKVAMVEDANIAAHVEQGLPMLFDEGKKGQAVTNNRRSIWNYDCTTVLASVMSIGEITNMSTTWKDIATMPAKMKEMKLTPKLIDNNVCILRFSQGTSIDFAKTGYFFAPPKYALTLQSPNWKPWSQRMALHGFTGAVVYDSTSDMGSLNTFVRDYLKDSFKQEIKESTRDFTFEFTENCDFEEMTRVKPVIAEIENNYRNELRALHDMALDKEQEKEFITSIMDKYQYAVMSIDADVRSIAAAAYVHTYYESSSKSNKISFPWITCFEGLLLNASETNTTKLKLRKASFTGHIDDIPSSVKIYRNASSTEDYTIDIKAPNGTYETHRRHGSLYLVMKSKSTAKKTIKAMTKVVDKTTLFQINSFTHNNSSATEVIELLKANDGVVRIQKVKDRGQQVNSLHAGVWIGGKRVGNVNRQQKHTLLPYLAEGAVDFRVQDFATLEPTYVAKRNAEIKEHKFLTLNFTLLAMVEGDVLTPSETNIEEYVTFDADYGVPYMGQPEYEMSAPIQTDFDFSDEVEEEAGILDFDYSILSKINMEKATYFEENIESVVSSIVGVTFERIGVTKAGNTCGKVKLIASNGVKTKSMTAYVRATKNCFEIESMDTDAGKKVQALILQVAHYELFKEHLATRKQA